MDTLVTTVKIVTSFTRPSSQKMKSKSLASVRHTAKSCVNFTRMIRTKNVKKKTVREPTAKLALTVKNQAFSIVSGFRPSVSHLFLASDATTWS